VGYPPFYADDPVTTCQKIANWKKTLVFPSESKQVSPTAQDLIRKLVCDAPSRLTFEDIKKHAWFKGINWNTIRTSRAAIVPELRDATDTRYFDHFDPLPSLDETISDEPDLNSFEGYTFKRMPQPRALKPELFVAPPE